MATDGKPAYSGSETVKLVDEATQSKYYAQIVSQVACDPSIGSLSFFHFVDELDGRASRAASSMPRSARGRSWRQ